MQNIVGNLGWSEELDKVVVGLEGKLSQIRRHLHRNPEPSGEEYETTKYLAGVLEGEGLRCKLGEDRRGILVEAANSLGVPPVTAFRGDIDALRIEETTGACYASEAKGLMHACGHDAHAACTVGAALALARLGEQGLLPWPVNWRGILQPAEETSEGAREMVALGALENVSGIFALHMDPIHPVGTVSLKDGAMTAACDEFWVEITGEGGHGARPHQTKDPIAAGVLLLSALYEQIPRAFDAQDTVVVTVGQFHAGSGANVIPDSAKLSGTFRTLSEKNRMGVEEKIRQIVKGIATITGCRMDLLIPVGCPGVTNDPELTNLVRDAAGMNGGVEVVELHRSSMGGEDFAEYQLHVPGCMFRLGCKPENGCTTLHSPNFDIDERALSIGSKLLARAVILHSKHGA